MIGVYLRISDRKGQKTDSQRAELTAWLKRHRPARATVQWFEDQETGATMQRDAFQDLQRAIFAGEVKTVVVWKLDRLARNLREGVNVLADWCQRGVRVVSVTQQIDLSGPVGHMIGRVEPMVTHPAPPQTRTCAIHACGSSGKAFCYPPTVPWGSGDTMGERRVSLVCQPTARSARRRLPSRGSLWISLPHLRRYYTTLRLPPGHLGVLRFVARSPIPCVLLWFVVSPEGSGCGRSAHTTPGPLVTRSPIPG
jgi:Resolvase, N terminal domain